MKLFKTSVLSALSTLIKMASSFIITKVISVYAGPSGLAIIGQLQNFINLIMLSAGGAFNTAVVKYTAEYNDDEGIKYQFWSAALGLSLLLNLLISAILFTFSNSLAILILNTATYSYVLKVFAISLPFFVLNTFLLSILNGQKQIKKFVTINIVLSFISLLLVVILTHFWKLNGALIAYVTNQSFVFIITLIILHRETWLRLSHFLYKIKREFVLKLLGFALITLSSVIASNLSMMFVRDYISENVSLESAGYWQGVWLLSQVVLTLIITSLSTYLLPKFSELNSKKLITREIINGSYLIIPLAVLVAIVMFLLRDVIISLLYTKEFMPMAPLFLWQLIGTIFKVAGWLFGYVLVAKAMVKYTVLTEIIFSILFCLLVVFFLDRYGLIGVTYAFAVNSLLHFITMLYIYSQKVH